MSPATSRRVTELSESVTLAVTAKAKSLRASGEHVVGFSAGEPDFPTPEHVVAAAQRACADPALHRYTPAGGWPELREAVAHKTGRDSGLEVDPSQVVVTNGAKHAIYQAFQALLDPGDEVLLPAPYWVSYPEQIRLAGGQPTVVHSEESAGFRVDVDALEAARTSATKAVVFTSPSNPTGAVYPPAEVEAIGRWAAKAGLWVLTDEIYEHLTFDEADHVSMPAVVPELAERCIVVNGVAKTYAMTGWRVGWAIAPQPLTAAMTRLQSHATSNVANVSQAAALAALTGPQEDVARMRAAFDRRRRRVHEQLNALPGVSCRMPEGTFYAFPSVDGLRGRTIGGHHVDSSLTLCEALLDTAKVALVPGEGFGSEGYVRLSFAVADSEVDIGLARLAEVLA